jgi:hypothetical protein
MIVRTPVSVGMPATAGTTTNRRNASNSRNGSNSTREGLQEQWGHLHQRDLPTIRGYK